MKALKQILVTTITTIACAFLVIWSSGTFGFRTPSFAFLANWLVMSGVAITGQAIHLSFGRNYYQIRPFERNGRIYECLGVRFFKRVVRSGPLSIFSPTLRLAGQRVALKDLEFEMRKAETGHCLIFLVMLVFVGYAGFKGWFDSVGWLLLFNIVLNGYPVMLQRYNRAKLLSLIERAEEASMKSSEA